MNRLCRSDCERAEYVISSNCVSVWSWVFWEKAQFQLFAHMRDIVSVQATLLEPYGCSMLLQRKLHSHVLASVYISLCHPDITRSAGQTDLFCCLLWEQGDTYVICDSFTYNFDESNPACWQTAQFCETSTTHVHWQASPLKSITNSAHRSQLHWAGMHLYRYEVYKHTYMDRNVDTFQRRLALHGKDTSAVDQHIHAFVSVQKGFGHLINAFGALHIAGNNIDFWCTSFFASLCSLQQADKVFLPLPDPFDNPQLHLADCHLWFCAVIADLT